MILKKRQTIHAYQILFSSALNLHAMRMGPGKHLQGRILMDGLVKPEEFDYFHEVSLDYQSKCLQGHDLSFYISS